MRRDIYSWRNSRSIGIKIYWNFGYFGERKLLTYRKIEILLCIIYAIVAKTDLLASGENGGRLANQTLFRLATVLMIVVMIVAVMIVRVVVVGVMTVVRMFVVHLLCGSRHIDNRHRHSVVVVMGNNGVCQQTDIGKQHKNYRRYSLHLFALTLAKLAIFRKTAKFLFLLYPLANVCHLSCGDILSFDAA